MRATLTRLTVDPQQSEDCINYMAFGVAESLSLKWQRQKRLEDQKLSTAMKNRIKKGAVANINLTYSETNTVTGLNVSSMAFK